MLKGKIRDYLMMNEKVHYKMYKAGKMWLVAGIALIGFGGKLTDVNADSKEAEIMFQSKADSSVQLRRNLVDNENRVSLLSNSIVNYSQDPIIFYYEARTLNNVTVQFVDVETGRVL